MKIILYSDEAIVRVIENAQDIVVDDNNIQWHDGEIRGVKIHFMIVEDSIGVDKETDVSVLQSYTGEPLDKFKSIEEQQAERIANLEAALLTVMDLM